MQIITKHKVNTEAIKLLLFELERYKSIFENSIYQPPYFYIDKYSHPNITINEMQYLIKKEHLNIEHHINNLYRIHLNNVRKPII